MKLQGRDLKINMRGEEVRQLHSELGRLGFDIPENEVQEKRYGRVTREAISRFQADHGLERSGIVDDQTTKVINDQIKKHPPETYLVHGHVLTVDGSPAADTRVGAYDVDVLSETWLGMAANTDKHGHFEIRYTEAQFRHSNRERGGADLIVR